MFTELQHLSLDSSSAWEGDRQGAVGWEELIVLGSEELIDVCVF